MIDVTQDIHSLTMFKRNSSGLMKRMKKTGRPLVLTIKGKAEAVLLDAATYQEVADHLDAIAGIRRGLAQAKRGEGRPAAEVLDELETRSLKTADALPGYPHATGRRRSFGGGNRGTYRFLFVVDGKSVYIVHLRHGSMLPLSPEE